MVAGMSSILAAAATPWAWLPDEKATTPARRLPASSWTRRLYAPRNLNDPVRCSDSTLRRIRPPSASSSGVAASKGVRRATPASLLAAACTSAKPGRGGKSFCALTGCYVSRMQGTLRTAHLAIGAVTIGAFLVTGMVMYAHEPPLSAMDRGDRLLFRSRHVYILCAGLVNLSLGLRYALPLGAPWRAAAVAGSVLALASTVLLFFAFFAEPMAGREPGRLSMSGVFALFAGVI